MNRNNKIQLLRGLAIIAIVFIHSCPRGTTQILVRPFLNFGVALFLFLSGYLTQIRDGDLFPFYKKRILRVLIPYIIWTVVYTLLFQNYSRIPFNLITARTHAHFYFIPVYIQFVLLSPLIEKLTQSKYCWVGWIITPLSLLLFTYIPLLSHQELPDKVSILWNICCLGWFSYYCLGVYLGKNKQDRITNDSRLFCYLVLALVLQVLEGFVFQGLNYYDPATQLKLSTLFTNSLFLVLCSQWLKKPKPEPSDHNLLVVIGNYSFGIYLTHLMLQSLLYNYNIISFRSIPFPINSLIILCLSFTLVFSLKHICGKQLSQYLGLQ